MEPLQQSCSSFDLLFPFMFFITWDTIIAALIAPPEVPAITSKIFLKLGIKIELSLLQIEFSDLIVLGSQISFNKKMKLGSKSFEIRDLSLYSRHVGSNRENI